MDTIKNCTIMIFPDLFFISNEGELQIQEMQKGEMETRTNGKSGAPPLNIRQTGRILEEKYLQFI